MFFMYLRSIGIFLNEQQVLEILFTRSKDTLSDNLNTYKYSSKKQSSSQHKQKS